ncbi:MAG: glycosyltransferase family 39 protein [Candidatus Acidiferrum sp.]
MSPVAHLAWIVLILATLYICYFHNLGAIGLVGPDEPRYAWIARDMAESGDWVTPRLYGKPWFEKPILYYWGAALSFKVFGVSEAAARFPSALAALFATFAMAWLAWRTYGAETARWLLLLLPTTVGMIGFSHAAATDMPFAGMLSIAMVFAAIVVGLVGNQDSTILLCARWLAPLFFGFFLGLAVLAKGPAAIILSGGAVLLWAVFTKRWRDAFRCLHPVAIASFCLTALPWYLLCARRNPNFFRIFIIEHNFKRYLTPEFQHIQPFWFYAPIVLVSFVPWTLLLLWSLPYGLNSQWKRRTSSLAFFLLIYALFCLVFFSASKSKLPGYILPAIPPIGMLLARAYVVLSKRREKSLRWFLSGFAILALPAGILLLWIGRHLHTPPTSAEAMVVVGCVVLAFALANLLLSIKEHLKNIPVAPVCVLPVLLLLMLFDQISLPWLPWDPSGRTLATELQVAKIPTDQIFVASMNRGQQYSLSFYLHREIPTWDSDQSREGWLLVHSRSCSVFVKSPAACAKEPVELGQSGWFLYRVQQIDLVSSLGGLSNFSGLNGSGNWNSANRQPR